MEKSAALKSFRLSFKFLLVLALSIFCFLSLFSSGTIESEDGWLYLSVARNIYYHHTITAPAQTDYPAYNVNMNSMKGSDGVWRSPGSIGYSFAMVPAVAFSDLFHRYYHVPPPKYFPLDSDWTLLFFASFTNIFFATCLCILVILYAKSLGLSDVYSVVTGILTLLSTGLFPMSKFGFPQLMFTCFLMLSFFLIRMLVKEKKIIYAPLVLASFLLLVSSYNFSWVLSIPAISLYFVFLHEEKFRVRAFVQVVIVGLLLFLIKPHFFIQFLPGILITPRVLFEGIWGFLFSSGKSIFLYSPPLLLLLIFWHKLNKRLLPELIGFGVLTLFFLYFIGSAWLPGTANRTPIWNGGMVWGPRYLTPLIPGLMLITFSLALEISKKVKKYFFYPLLCFSIIIQLCGVSAYYLLQYSGLPYSIMVGKDELSVYDYASFIPRYSPLRLLPHAVISLLHHFPQTIRHGPYDLRLYDGFDIPLDTGHQTFRGFRQEGHLALRDAAKKPIQTVSILLSNVPDEGVSSESARIDIRSHNHQIQILDLSINRDQMIILKRNDFLWEGKDALLDLYVSYHTIPLFPHVIYIKSLRVNDTFENLGSFDYPDASSISLSTTPIPYQYFGGRQSNLKALWDMRSRISESTLDFWWIKNFYYWDRPQSLIWTIFAGDLTLFISSLLVLLVWSRKRV